MITSNDVGGLSVSIGKFCLSGGIFYFLPAVQESWERGEEGELLTGGGSGYQFGERHGGRGEQTLQQAGVGVGQPGGRRRGDHDGLEGVLHLSVTAPVGGVGAGVGGPVQGPGQTC